MFRTILKKTMLRLIDILSCKDSQMIELILGLSALGWGMPLLINSEAFHSVTAYSLLARMCQYELFWGILFCVMGLTQVISLLAGSIIVRKAVTFWCCLVWLFLTIVAALSNPSAPAGPTATIFTFALVWVYWRQENGITR